MQLTDLDLHSVFPYQEIFNPTITRQKNGNWQLVCRLQNHASEGFLGICFLDESFRPVSPGTVISRSPVQTGSVHPMLEDPRTFIHEGKTYITHVESSASFLYFCYTVFGAFNIKGEWEAAVVPDYKKNKRAFEKVRELGNRDGEITLPQKDWLVDKNWQFFIRENKYYCIYRAGEKNEVFRFDFPGGTVREKFISFHQLNWNYGRMSGGASPVLHDDGYYYSFFHSWTDWSDASEKHPWQQRKYHIGVYLFDPVPPFRIRMMSSQPLISGSNTERLAASGHSVVFPGSAWYEKESRQWIIAIGWNDHSCKILRLDHDALRDKLETVKKMSIPAILKKESVHYIKNMRAIAGRIVRHAIGIK